MGKIRQLSATRSRSALANPEPCSAWASADVGGRSVGLSALVKAMSSVGYQKNSKCLFAAMRTSSVARQASSGSRRTCSCNRYRGKSRNRTDVMTPSDPNETRAARNSSLSASGEQSMTSPPAVTIRKPTTCVEILPKVGPVPWVPVEIAPAMACTSTSPWFSRRQSVIGQRPAEIVDFCTGSNRGAAGRRDRPIRCPSAGRAR